MEFLGIRFQSISSGEVQHAKEHVYQEKGEGRSTFLRDTHLSMIGSLYPLNYQCAQPTEIRTLGRFL